MTAAPVPVAVRVFPGQAGQAGQARRWVRALVSAAGVLRTADAELAAGELFANAVRHTRSGTRGGMVAVAVTADGVIHVHDQGDGSGQPGARMTALLPGNEDLPAGGRGLAIVAALCAGWGCMPANRCRAAGPGDPAAATEGGCCVWCRPASRVTRPDREEDWAYATA